MQKPSAGAHAVRLRTDRRGHDAAGVLIGRHNRRSVAGSLAAVECRLHVPELAKRLHSASFILRATAPLRDRGDAKLGDDLRNCGGA